MGDTTAISWADHTFNPVIGCTEVDEECTNCYARELAERYGWARWGVHQPRHRTSVANWRKPYQWDRRALRDGVRRRVFCASLADVFDAEWPAEVRADLWQVIRDTPHLNWLLLTKRPNLIQRYLPADWGDGWPQVWLGTTVGHQAATWRVLALLQVPAVVRFLSCEPLLGPVGLRDLLYPNCHDPEAVCIDALGGEWAPPGPCPLPGTIDWVIAGGESGAHHRPMDWVWARSLQQQCHAAGTAFWWKQQGGTRPGTGTLLDGVEYHELPIPRVAVAV